MKWPLLIFFSHLLIHPLWASEMDFILSSLKEQSVVIGTLSQQEIQNKEATPKINDNPLELELVDTVSTVQAAGTDFIDLDSVEGEVAAAKKLEVPMQNTPVVSNREKASDEDLAPIPVFYFN